MQGGGEAASFVAIKKAYSSIFSQPLYGNFKLLKIVTVEKIHHHAVSR